MRFALSLASVLVLGSAAFAEEATPPAAPAPATTPAAAPAARPAKKLPLRVVRVLEDTQQALMFDKANSTHVLVEVGKQIDGFTVTDIDEDSVTLTAEGGQQIVLAGPDPSWRGNGRHAQQKAKPVAKAATAAPEDPYAAAPMDPYGDDGVRTAEAPSATAAPITAGEGGVRTAVAPAGGATETVRSAEAPGTPAKVVVTATIPSSTIPTAVPSTTVAPTSTSPSPSTSTTTVTPTTTPTPPGPTAAPIVSAAAPVEAPVAAPSAEPAAPQDTSSSAAWSTTPTAPVDRETAAIVGLLTDSSPAATTKAKAAAKASKTAKKDPKIASVSAAGTPAGAAVAATAAPSTDGATIIAKADVTAALGNFSALANAVRGSFTAGGAHLDAVAPDSLFARAGLQAGDTVTAINNQPLRSLDDAATLYSRAGSMKSATIQIQRAGKPLSLHLAIQ